MPLDAFESGRPALDAQGEADLPVEFGLLSGACGEKTAPTQKVSARFHPQQTALVTTSGTALLATSGL